MLAEGHTNTQHTFPHQRSPQWDVTESQKSRSQAEKMWTLIETCGPHHPG